MKQLHNPCHLGVPKAGRNQKSYVTLALSRSPDTLHCQKGLYIWAGETVHCQKGPYIRAWGHLALPKRPLYLGMGTLCTAKKAFVSGQGKLCTAKKAPVFRHGDTPSFVCPVRCAYWGLTSMYTSRRTDRRPPFKFAPLTPCRGCRPR